MWEDSIIDDPSHPSCGTVSALLCRDITDHTRGKATHTPSFGADDKYRLSYLAATDPRGADLPTQVRNLFDYDQTILPSGVRIGSCGVDTD
jgi:hypothetical protein